MTKDSGSPAPRVLETRKGQFGFKRRRYDTGAATLEVPLGVWNILIAGGSRAEKTRRQMLDQNKGVATYLKRLRLGAIR